MAHALTRYEVSRIVGLRALQLAETEPPRVQVHDARLRENAVYLATRELYEGQTDALVARGESGYVPVRACALPPDVALYLNTHDGGTRAAATLHVPPHAPASSSVRLSVFRDS